MDSQHRHFSGESSDAGRKRRYCKRSSQACVYCQHLKMKCSGSIPCERCLRVGKACEPSRRPLRRPWTRKKDNEIQSLTTRLEEMENMLAGKGLDAPTAVPADSHPIAWPEPSPSSSSCYPGSLASLPFVSTGRITSEEASELHDLFVHSCLLHVPLLDPEWHTLWQTSTTCPFLFACIIHVAANYYTPRPQLRAEMQAEMNGLIGSVITAGTKSVGIIQGFFVLYFWNEPCAQLEKDLAWTYSGLALRMAVEMNLQSSVRGKESERERIDRERTWMFCFLVDRTLSVARGKRWSLHGDDGIVSNAASWYSQPICRPWDLGVSALAELLKVTSRQTDVLNESLLAGSGLFDCDMMMRLLNDELQQWRKRWYARGFFTSPSGYGAMADSPMTSASEGMDVHLRTLFYITKQASLRYNYAVLVLNCAGLQYCAANPDRSEAKTYVLTHAIQAAQGIVMAARDGLRYTAAFWPQTQCTILSFAIISLIKMASLKRDDALISARLMELVESGIAFLEAVALRSTHVPARCASMLRGLLRRSHQTEGAATFRPGMEMHSLPVRSSRAVTPNGKQDGPVLALTGESLDELAQEQARGAFDMLADTPPTSFTLLGNGGSTGFAQMTADEILDDSFWLCLPAFSPA